MYMNMTYYVYMESANINQVREHLADYLSLVEKGEEVEICKRNVPVARIVPIVKVKRVNRTKLGSGIGSGEILGSLTDPFIPESDWEMLR